MTLQTNRVYSLSSLLPSGCLIYNYQGFPLFWICRCAEWFLIGQVHLQHRLPEGMMPFSLIYKP